MESARIRADPVGSTALQAEEARVRVGEGVAVGVGVGKGVLLGEPLGITEVEGDCDSAREADCVGEPVGVAEGVSEAVGVLPSSVGLRDGVMVPVCERVLVRLAEGVGVGVGTMHATRVTAPAAPGKSPATPVPKPTAVVLVTWRGLV